MSGLGEPVATWDRTTARCGECGTVFGGCGCPNCGELVDAEPMTMFGYVVDRDDGPHLVTVEQGQDGWAGSERPISEEQVAWLRR